MRGGGGVGVGGGGGEGVSKQVREGIGGREWGGGGVMEVTNAC